MVMLTVKAKETQVSVFRKLKSESELLLGFVTM